MSDALTEQEFDRLVAQEELLIEITERVVEAMSIRGMTRSELAQAVGVSPSEITQRLRGSRNMRLGTISDMFSALGFKLESALVDERVPKPAAHWATTSGYKVTITNSTGREGPLRFTTPAAAQATLLARGTGTR